MPFKFAVPDQVAPGKYTWHDLKVARAGAGYGLFASVDIEAGYWIPIVGPLQCEGAPGQWTHQSQRFGRVDGNPSIDGFENAGSFGLAIAMMANEADHTTPRPNCRFMLDYMVTTEFIRSGQELLTDYGASYERIGYTNLRTQDTRDAEKYVDLLLLAQPGMSPPVQLRLQYLDAVQELYRKASIAWQVGSTPTPSTTPNFLEATDCEEFVLPVLSVEPRAACAMACGAYSWEQVISKQNLVKESRLPLKVLIYAMPNVNNHRGIGLGRQLVSLTPLSLGPDFYCLTRVRPRWGKLQAQTMHELASATTKTLWNGNDALCHSLVQVPSSASA